MRRGACALLIAAGLVAGCDDTPTAPDPPTTATIFFTSRIAKGGFAWRSFFTETSGEVKVQLSSLIPQVGSAVDLAIGTFDGTNCAVTRRVEATPSAEAQIVETLAAGTYCVQIADLGQLTSNNDFSISIVIPLPPS